ncbi:MAG TPA: hypothetical protein VH477_00135 [Bryobacteraceae bacterium]
MSIESKRSGRLDEPAPFQRGEGSQLEPAPFQRGEGSKHWTDDQLIAHLYGVGPQDGHLECCAECRSRVSAMEIRRQSAVAESAEVAPERLAAQRRRVRAVLARSLHWWQAASLRRWVPAGTAAIALGGSLFYYNEQQQRHVRDNAISDAQLAQDVSLLAETPEAPPTAPLQALFVQ